MNLFILLYLDEDVSVLIAEILRARGFDVITTTEAGLRGKSDVEQLEYAVSSHRTILTHNRIDFEKLAELYFRNGKIHYGIMIARRHDPYELVRRVLVILDETTADEMVNQIRYI
ncbi:MAG: hypothetical protein OHK0022_25090 [Roseiflexaceae bacterium]